MTDQIVEHTLSKEPITLALYRRYRARGKSPQDAWQEILRSRPDLQPPDPSKQVFFRVYHT